MAEQRSVEGTSTEFSRPRFIGKPIQRMEDPRLLTGRGRFVADIRLPRMVHLAFVRSDRVYARIARVETGAARDIAGVIGVFTASDFAHIPDIEAQSTMPGYVRTACPVIARSVVRYVGEPMAAIAATSRYLAEDAAALVEIDYEPLEVAASTTEALAPGAPVLHEGLASNVIVERTFMEGDAPAAIAGAPHSVSGRFRLTRKTATPIEPRATVAEYDSGRDMVTVYSATQIPGIVKDEISRLLGLDGNRIRVVAPDVGGGFGVKASLYPEEVAVAALARRLDRPVKFVSDRLEDLTSGSQAFDEEIDATLAFDGDGRFIALDAEIVGDVGAYSIYPWTAALEPVQVAGFLPGPYRIPHYRGHVRGVCTPKPPTGPYRGVGRPMAVFALERLVDMAAARLGVSPVDLRRRNLVEAEEFPHRIGSGIVWDRSGFQECLTAVEQAVDLPALRIEKAARKDKWIGVGFASYAELTGIGSRIAVAPGMPMNTGAETASIRIDSTGSIVATFAVASHGQSLETTLAQIVAEELGASPERIRIVHGDTAGTPHGTGTYASRSAVIGGGAAIKTARTLARKIKRAAATLFDVEPDRIETGDGRIFVPGTNLSTDFAGLAKAVYSDMSALPVEARQTLEAQETYDPVSGTTSSATHAAVVEIDSQTLIVRLRSFLVAEDCGKVINPLVVDGQVHGGVAQGVGAALLEELKFDETGQPIAVTLADYLVPTSAELPDIDVLHPENATPDNLGGFRGMGEGGTIGAPAAIANAVCDALSHLGIRVDELPITPDRLHRLIAAAGRGMG